MNEITETPDQQAELLEPGQPSLLERAAAIDRKHGKVVRTAWYAVQRWIALGHELAEAKRQVREQLGPKKWLMWLEENTEVSPRTAQLALRFAGYESELRERLQEENRNVALLSIRSADQIIRSIKQEQNGGGAGGHNGDSDDGGDEGDDGANGTDDEPNDNGHEEEDDPDAKQFEALRRAYEEAEEPAREAFHEHLEVVYGLEVRPFTRQSKRPDSEPAAA